jgi:hypothetical protein
MRAVYFDHDEEVDEITCHIRLLTVIIIEIKTLIGMRYPRNTISAKITID